MILNGDYKEFRVVSLFINYLKHCLGFNRNPDPAFYLNVDADPDLESIEGTSMRLLADPDPDQTLPSQ
jgi:hypothetical protein